jgi:ABC-2 type transport system ATP-binding protein|tara:strand:+ start:1617 stop:2495 length:879 start_codon:yes stop_codon:yes gene_type:complete
MMAIIEMQNLQRSFADNQVLIDLDFSIQPGTITGLLGVNGSGKTTLMHCALGMLRPQSGTCQILGEESWAASPAARRKIGFVPQSFDSFEWMTLKQILMYTSAFYETWDSTFTDHLVSRFELPLNEPIVKMSLGMKQRVSIVLALGHNPELIVLDEPVAALDPKGRREFVQVILDLHMSEGKTILFSTHITSDIERVAAEVALLQAGKIALHTNLDDLKQRYTRYHLHGQKDLTDVVEQIPNKVTSEVIGASAKVTVESPHIDSPARIGPIDDVEIVKEALNLEEIFLELSA